MTTLKIEELEPRVVPSVTLSVTIPADTAQADITTVPPDPAPVNAEAAAADDATDIVTVA